MSEQPNRDDAGRFTPAPAAPEHRATEVSDAMSRAGETGKPTDAFEPMKMATPAPAKESTFDDSVEGLRAAAAEVTKRRQQDQAAPTPRAYYDAQSGERVAPTQTRTLP